ncbi:acetyl-CoA carboxylase biotin carboxyl carrier protein subunit [uncultured Draconibacterium sp.]|uniref:acetyl-CoA carboxylase biotin carboxyl carrier protein subunit n=1 Tax=uncultured Draconibacterium sp. TaxID=1573823 RepID=UPI0029C8EA36|nr:acetyl-CoA carboxylase biotin carboxyl carrier protein subunit [uncultured Draconibacterium sp.]
MKTKISKYIVSGTKRFRYNVSNYKIRKRKNRKINRTEDGLYAVNIENKAFSGSVIKKKQNKYQVEVNGNFYHFILEQEETAKRVKTIKQNAAKNKVYAITAPMPGKIKDIFVSQNTMVKKGEPLLILEAMKMQNQVLASKDAIVRELKIKEEQTVLSDQELIILESK